MSKHHGVLAITASNPAGLTLIELLGFVVATTADIGIRVYPYELRQLMKAAREQNRYFEQDERVYIDAG